MNNEQRMLYSTVWNDIDQALNDLASGETRRAGQYARAGVDAGNQLLFVLHRDDPAVPHLRSLVEQGEQITRSTDHTLRPGRMRRLLHAVTPTRTVSGTAEPTMFTPADHQQQHIVPPTGPGYGL